MNLKDFNSAKEMHMFLRDNKDKLIQQKKSAVKEADGVCFVSNSDIELGLNFKMSNNICTKANEAIQGYEELDRIKVEAVINTTNLLDSHGDVHIPGLWKKTISENGNIKHLQEHVRSFETIIADYKNLRVKTQNINWTDLGQPYGSKTQALIFNSIVLKERNPFMFEQYAKGHVTNHSVGMRYVNIYLAVNSEESYMKEEKDNWDKYISKVANVELAEEKGFFYPVTEAKIIEGSAVVFGSNPVTPTLDNNKLLELEQQENKEIDYEYMNKNITL